MHVVDKFKDVRVLCVGDVILDRFTHGHVMQISPESPVPVFSPNSHQVFPGGSANVARNIASLGGRVCIIGVIGEDDAGIELDELLARIPNIRRVLPIEASRPTTAKTRLIAQGQHVLRTDLEVSKALGATTEKEVIAAIERNLNGCDVVVLSDYAKGVLTPSVLAFTIAKARGLGLPVIVDPKSPDFGRYAGATVVTPNGREVKEAIGFDPTEDDEATVKAAEQIIRTAGIKSVLLTRGHKGMTHVGREGGVVHIPANAREVFDVVGAGDTVVAALSLALGARIPIPEAAPHRQHSGWHRGRKEGHRDGFTHRTH